MRVSVTFLLLVGALAHGGCNQDPDLTQVELADGDVVVGHVVSADPERLVVSTPDGQMVSIDRSNVVSFGTASAETILVEEMPPMNGGSRSSGSGDHSDSSEGSGLSNTGNGGETGTPRSIPPTQDVEYATVTLPAGTELSIVLQTAVASDTSRVEDQLMGRLARSAVVDGYELFPSDAVVTGSVVEATPSGRVQGRARLGIRFETIQDSQGVDHPVRTTPIKREAEGTKRDDAAAIGIGAGAGALIGGLVGGGDGAAAGAAAGAGAGTAGVLMTTGDEVRLVTGTTLRTTLLAPLTLRVAVVPEG